MSTNPTSEQREAFYRAALAGLRALDVREKSPRRFGADPDLRSDSFRGHLGTADRVDILIRDAAVRWGAAFSPARVFGLPGLAADEPFGPDWTPLTEAQAKAAWNDESTVPTIAACGDVLAVDDVGVDVPSIRPTTRLVVAGGAAVRAVGEAFVDRDELSWPDRYSSSPTRPRRVSLQASSRSS